MQRRKLFIMLGTAGFLLVVASAIALALPQPAQAQCGSQASSCKNCHEVQAKDPVNADGTGWHQSHAFGDFCYICHGGNSQATEETAAHQGMVNPMSDVKAACQQCHAADLQARADVYAKVLNVPVGMGASAPAPAATSAPEAAQPGPQPAAEVAPVEPAAPAAGSGELVDYVQRYDESVLGRYKTNWGNVILWALIAILALGGGTMVLLREKLVRVTFQDTRPLQGEYPADVIDMLPDVAKLKPAARKSLSRMLKRSDAGRMLNAVDTLQGNEEE